MGQELLLLLFPLSSAEAFNCLTTLDLAWRFAPCSLPGYSIRSAEPLRRRVYYFSFMNRIPAQKQSHTIARFDRDRQSCRRRSPGKGGTSIQTYTGRAVFQGIIFQHKFLNRVWKLIRNSETGYDYMFKHKRLLFSRTMGYCSPYCFPIVL